MKILNGNFRGFRINIFKVNTVLKGNIFEFNPVEERFQRLVLKVNGRNFILKLLLQVS